MKKNNNFYPRSPCGERPKYHRILLRRSAFLSTLSLRRATQSSAKSIPEEEYFYPRSPCGERLPLSGSLCCLIIFLSTLSLRRATRESDTEERSQGISIHARLAESYVSAKLRVFRMDYFYPRSPCGERRSAGSGFCRPRYFYPRSPCGERPAWNRFAQRRDFISIHALLAESDICVNKIPYQRKIFLSTLSLRRATMHALIFTNLMLFLSTLSLRRATQANILKLYR